MNGLVYAQLVQLHANAQLRVERLEAKHRETPNTIGKHGARLSLFRQMAEAKDQAKSWHYLMESALLSAEDDADGADRIVAYRNKTFGTMLCTACARPLSRLSDALTSEDLPDGGVCVMCHVDVLA